MKAKKLWALLLCLLTAFVLLAFSASAEEVVYCEHGEENYRWLKTEQTCKQDGKYEQICDICYAENPDMKPFVTLVIPKHNFVEIYTGKTATCTEEGFVSYYCDWCNLLENRVTEIDPDNHLFNEWTVTVEPNCMVEGTKVRECIRPGCDYVETGSVPVVESAHEPLNENWETVKASDCYEEGIEKNVCAICLKEYTRAIPTHNDYATNTVDYNIVETKEGNCSQLASVKYYCKQCGISFVITGKADPDKHDYSDKSLWFYSVGASCKHKGKLTKHCKNAYHHTVVEEYAPHTFEGVETVIKAPSCKEDGTMESGTKTIKCIYCDEVKTETIPAGEHSFGDWVITQGNCASGGKAVRTCICQKKTEEIDFAPGTHLNYNLLHRELPTCLNPGTLYVECKAAGCGKRVYLFPDELKSKMAHTPASDWVITEEATCDKSGVRERYCDVCDEVLKREVIEQKAHNCVILKKGTEATCTELGITDYLYCMECGITFEQELLPARGHNFVEQISPEDGAAKICDRCYQYEVGDSTCKCLCHNSNGIARAIWKVVVFFCKLFGFNELCKCGIAHF